MYPYPFKAYCADGTEILVSNLEIVNLDEHLSIKFNLPSDCEGLLFFELKNAYDVVKADENTEYVTVKTYFYIKRIKEIKTAPNRA